MRYLTIFCGRQFSGFKWECFRHHILSNIIKYCQISSDIVRLKYKKFFYHQKVPLVKPKLSLLVCEKIPVRNAFFYSHSFFFFFTPNTTAICKDKIPPSSEPEIISKELENSHLSSFSVNLTDIFKIIAKYRRKVISKYRQKSLFIA